jgi:hypothetical protein
MSADPINNARPPRRVAPPVAGQRKSSSMRLGPLTQRFFLRAQEQEATEYKDLVDPSILEAPKLEFDSFDEIPRKRRPLLAVVGLMSLLAVGGIAWKMTRGLPSVKASARAAVAAEPAAASTPRAVAQPIATAPPAPAPAAMVATPTTTAAAPAPAPVAAAPEPEAPPAAAPFTPAASGREPVVEPIAARPTAPAPDRVPVIVPIRATSRARVAAEESRPTTSAVKHRSGPLRGYVWSPEAHALVPAAGETPEAEPGIAAPTPSAAPAERPVTDPGDTSPAPFETKKGAATTEAAPILN